MTPVYDRSLMNVFYRFHSYGLRSDADRFPFLPETFRHVAENIGGIVVKVNAWGGGQGVGKV